MGDQVDTKASGHSLKTLVAVGAACSALSSIGTFVATYKAKADDHIRLIATAVAAPIEKKMDDHAKEAHDAMSPGGAMYDEFADTRRQVRWLVKEQICRTVRGQPCPPLADVIGNDNDK